MFDCGPKEMTLLNIAVANHLWSLSFLEKRVLHSTFALQLILANGMFFVSAER